MKYEALRLALEALKQSKPQLYGLSAQIVHENAITAAEAALKAKDEPVCDKDPQGCWSVRCQLGNQCKNTPPQRKPLTDEEIQQIFIANSVVVDNGNAYMVAGLRAVNIARAIEAAHGIKGEA